MKKLFTVFALLFSMVSYAQPRDAYNNIMDQFKRAYNEGQPSFVLPSFTDELHAKWEDEKFKNYLEQQKSTYGDMLEYHPLVVDDAGASFKVDAGDKALFVKLNVNSQNLVESFTLRKYEDSKYPVLGRNITKLALPFNGEWTVLWVGGGEGSSRNKGTMLQRGSSDFVITDKENRTFKNDGMDNEDYFAFGQQVTAPCEAVVVDVVDGIKDNNPGDMNGLYAAGNSVMLKTANNEYIFLAHFKEGSVKVKKGDKVKKGEVIAICGNSGNTLEPALHFHIQNSADHGSAMVATSFFSNVKVTAYGKSAARDEYIPAKGDKVKH